MIISYTLCGITWGIVFTIIGLQEGQAISKTVAEYPEPLRKPIIILGAVFIIVFEALAWPIDVPYMLYKMYIKKPD